MKRLLAISALTAPPLLVATLLTAPPATAAGSGAPKVRIISDVTTFENTLTRLDVRYRCATGTTAMLVGSLRQGGTEAAPRSVYDTNNPDAAVRPNPLICDGDRHVAQVGLILVGSVDGAPSLLYEPLNSTAIAGERVHATVVLTDLRTGKTDRDDDRLTAAPR